MKRIQNKTGEGYIETVVSVIASMMVVAFVLNIFSFITLKQDMDFYAAEITEKACFEGNTLVGMDETKAMLTEQTGIDPEISFAGTEYFNSAAGKVQYGENIKVKITYQTYIKGLGVIKLPITLTSSCSGLSRRYWK